MKNINCLTSAEVCLNTVHFSTMHKHSLCIGKRRKTMTFCSKNLSRIISRQRLPAQWASSLNKVTNDNGTNYGTRSSRHETAGRGKKNKKWNNRKQRYGRLLWIICCLPGPFLPLKENKNPTVKISMLMVRTMQHRQNPNFKILFTHNSEMIDVEKIHKSM